MNTRLLMSASAIFMGLIGIALTFTAEELMTAAGQKPNELSILTLQFTGALYFGFAITNWMAKGVLIGGIYARPLSIGNFSHFFIAGLALVKFLSNNGSTSPIFMYGLAVVYIVFATSFGYVFVTHPKKALSNS